MTTKCFHCQAAITDGIDVSAEFNGSTRYFCCHACLGVTSIIHAHDLNRYYEVRDKIAKRPERQFDAEHWQAYDIPEIAKQYVFEDDGTQEIHLCLDGIHCSACSWLIRSALKEAHHIDDVHINTTTGRAEIRWQNTKLSAILNTLSTLGYTPNLFTPEAGERNYHRQRNQALLRLIVAGLGTMQVMMFATGLYTGAFHGIDQEYSELLRWISFILTTPILFYAGWPFISSAWQSIRAKSVNMDVPISIATVGAYIASAYHTIIGHGEVYFESVAMFIFFISISRFIEFLTRRRAQLNEYRFARLLPDAVYRLDNGEQYLVPLTTIQPGDYVFVLPTHTIPIDGTITAGSTRVDEAMLTGESTPIHKKSKDKVLAGSTNLESPVTIYVTQTGQETTLAGIRRIISRSEQHRSPQIERNETIAQWSIIIVLALAVSGYLLWQFIDATRSFEIALAILVATCPCALSLATPAALTSALNHAHRFGILIKDSNTLDHLAHIKHIIFDKTGTLTEGNFHLLDHKILSDNPDQLWRIAKTLEINSTHPIAWYFTNQPVDSLHAQHIQQAVGLGVRADIDQQTWAIGSAQWINHCFPQHDIPNLNTDGTQVYLANQTQVAAWFVFGDPLRDNLSATLDELQAYSLHIASGDRQANVSKVAQQLAIKQYAGNLSAQDKLDYLHNLQGAVMMVGDGINDAPVLAAADVSIAVGKANPLSQTHADIVLLNQGPEAIPFLFQLTAKTQRVMKQNITWATIYNFTILPLAVVGVLTPWMAALGMSLSSLLVVGNAMRVNRIKF